MSCSALSVPSAMFLVDGGALYCFIICSKSVCTGILVDFCGGPLQFFVSLNLSEPFPANCEWILCGLTCWSPPTYAPNTDMNWATVFVFLKFRENQSNANEKNPCDDGAKCEEVLCYFQRMRTVHAQDGFVRENWYRLYRRFGETKEKTRRQESRNMLATSF